jgi:hypothetical protein
VRCACAKRGGSRAGSRGGAAHAHTHTHSLDTQANARALLAKQNDAHGAHICTTHALHTHARPLSHPARPRRKHRRARIDAARQVAERSLFLWNNEYIVSLVAQFRHDVLPMVFGPLQARRPGSVAGRRGPARRRRAAGGGGRAGARRAVGAS